MESLDPACTPLKHAYDSCFSAWFRAALELGSVPAPQTTPAPVPASAQQEGGTNRRSSTSSWFSFGASSSSSSSSGSASTAPTSPAESTSSRLPRTRTEPASADELVQGYNACDQLFKSYQGCVRRAVQEKGLIPLIHEARRINPFPFPSHTAGGPMPDGASTDGPATASVANQSGNAPFPFPQAANDQETFDRPLA
ncbi:hypothetical protein OC846_000857 [Tilletia horrida]|uniref:Uncharacterized protein n=1 Tax=Tilletia horrida TaxID=155126 RepID=A0AAN6JUB0_9BASI|nr:hypothetical protein OC846_000857 [Tilletia horrida]